MLEHIKEIHFVEFQREYLEIVQIKSRIHDDENDTKDKLHQTQFQLFNMNVKSCSKYLFIAFIQPLLLSNVAT